MSVFSHIQGRLTDLSPAAKRWGAVGGAALVVIVVVALLVPDSEPRKRSRVEDISSIRLTDRDTREVSIEALAAQISTLNDENARLRRDMDRLGADGPRSRSAQGMDEATERELHALRQQGMELQRQLRELNQRLVREQGRTGTGRGADGAPSRADEVFAPAPTERATTGGVDDDAFRVPPPPGVTAPGSVLPPVTEAGVRDGRQPREGSAVAAMRVISQPEAPEDKARAERRRERERPTPGAHLPAGSIISGVLITGMDAPTGQAGRRDPFPALLRVQAEAILPNRFRSDIRECFILMSGHGDLSSERAYLRGESVSCVAEDGTVIESRIQGYAVGSDGKAGIRGRLVSKQGQLIARSMMAGFMEGMANAFSLSNVPVISTTPADRVQWERRMSSESLQAASLSGAGRALDRIAQYYLEMAEGMYPVIEIDAGREVEFVINSGLKLAEPSGRFMERN